VPKAIHVIPGGEDDWLVCEDSGREFGDYPTRKEAEAVGNKLARKRSRARIQPIRHAARMPSR
jgi:uncharacterized protein DUF2188